MQEPAQGYILPVFDVIYKWSTQEGTLYWCFLLTKIYVPSITECAGISNEAGDCFRLLSYFKSKDTELVSQPCALISLNIQLKKTNTGQCFSPQEPHRSMLSVVNNWAPNHTLSLLSRSLLLSLYFHCPRYFSCLLLLLPRTTGSSYNLKINSPDS